MNAIRRLRDIADRHLSSHEGTTDALRAEFAALVLRTLKMRGMTQRSLADAAGMNESEISELVHADENFTVSTMGRVLFALGLQVKLEVREDSESATSTQQVTEDSRNAKAEVEQVNDLRVLQADAYFPKAKAQDSTSAQQIFLKCILTSTHPPTPERNAPLVWAGLGSPNSEWFRHVVFAPNVGGLDEVDVSKRLKRGDSRLQHDLPRGIAFFGGGAHVHVDLPPSRDIQPAEEKPRGIRLREARRRACG